MPLLPLLHRVKPQRETNLQYYVLCLTAGEKRMMLVLIVLGAISKLALVSADCDIQTTNYKTTDWTNVSHSADAVCECSPLNRTWRPIGL
jgi:hypothetical protein